MCNTHMHTVTHIHAERCMCIHTCMDMQTCTHLDRDMGTCDTDMYVMDLGVQAHTQIWTHGSVDTQTHMYTCTHTHVHSHRHS